MSKLYFFVVAILLPVLAVAQTGSITGTVKDKRTQRSVPDITIVVAGTTSGATSDSNGKFTITGIPTGSYNINVSGIGYEATTVFNVVVSSGNEQVLAIEVDAKNEQLKEVTVRRSYFSRTAETPLSVQNLSAQEIKSNPGGNFDVSRVVQAFPGVGGTSGVGGYRNDLIIRGGAPNENVYYLDGIEVPVINHFATQGSAGGPTGIINISFIQDVNLYTSAFPAKYDNPLSGVLQLKMKEASADKVQHNVRLSATELAYSLEGPINDKISFQASARRSYLQFLFQALQIPIQPSYWDFQYKVNYKINKKLSFYTLGIGAIDNFTFITPDDLTPENVYILRANPLIKQWSYTNGYGLKKLIDKGYWNLTFSRNMLNNRLDKYLDNQVPVESERSLGIKSTEGETKLRFELNKFKGAISYSYGAMIQNDRYTNNLFLKYRNAVTDTNGNVLVPAVILKGSTDLSFVKYGLFGQVAGKYLDGRLTVSVGARLDGNTFMGDGTQYLLSPRGAFSYAFLKDFKFNASVGSYYKIPSYTLLGYTDSAGNYVNKNMKYIRCDHYVAGFEYTPHWPGARFTLEGFSKQYTNYPVSLIDGISLANKGGDFSVLGNEPVSSTGKGRAYGVEFQFQQKLTKNFFVILSYTHYKSEFTNANGKYVPASWDNGDLLSFIGGYKFKRNIELGVKFRYQGGAPYTPLDMAASQANYSTLGTGILDYARFNSLRLGAFNSMDIRLDKKWNLKKFTFDLYIDITNAYASTTPQFPTFTFKRTTDNKDFLTTDGKPLRADGSNGIPLILDNSSAVVIPTIGFIIEF